MVAAGGLHIIGSERHESRRIDNQLRGRSGRQGDPGSSRFYLSMEDPLLKIFAGDRLKAIMDRLKLPDGEAIAFDVDAFRKHCLLEGLDDIGLTLQHVDEIRAYEARWRLASPWLFPG